MKNLKEIENENLIFGEWSGQLPHMNKSYFVSEPVFEQVKTALKTGKKIYVGNSPGRDAERISQVNSRYHGYSIRTIHILN